mgnify:CR=1 FL=1
MKDGKFLTMAIESSCDETAIAVVADGRTVLSNVISSQIDIFKPFKNIKVGQRSETGGKFANTY